MGCAGSKGGAAAPPKKKEGEADEGNAQAEAPAEQPAGDAPAGDVSICSSNEAIHSLLINWSFGDPLW